AADPDGDVHRAPHLVRVVRGRGTSCRRRCQRWEHAFAKRCPMARERLRSHLSGSVPVSIAVHLLALLLVFVIPLLNVVLPVPAQVMPGIVLAAPLPPPPAPPVPRRGGPAPSPSPSPSALAPTVAPNDIQPETSTAVPDIPGAVPGGIGTDNGFPGPVGLTPPAPPPVPDPPR